MATLDNYSWDTEVVFAVRSGTNWTLDVTAANLDEDLSVIDFAVLFDDIPVSALDFAKTTAELVTYTGPAMSGTVEFRRFTPVEPRNLVQYQERFSSDDYNKNLERVARQIAEFRAQGVGVGSTEVSVLPDAYGPGWAGDVSNAPARSAVYAEVESVKSSLTAGDAALQGQLDAKAPLASPALSGVPTVPTAEVDDNSPQVANTAYVKANRGASEASTATALTSAIAAAKSELYPVGTIYYNAAVATNPGTLLGFGVWAPTLVGRVAVGIDASQTEFNTLAETGGAKTHTLTVGEMPSHSHGIRMDGGVFDESVTGPKATVTPGSNTVFNDRLISTGGGGAHNNLQPYQVVHAWVRTS